MSLQILLESEYSSEELAQFVKDITTHLNSLAKIVEEIGSHLVNTDLKIRIKALKLLSDIVVNLPNDYFNQKEDEVIFKYFSSCIADHHSITPISIRVFNKLLKLKEVPHLMTSKILKCIFNDVIVQSLSQADRMLVYTIFNHSMKMYDKEIKEMEAEFIMGIIQACDSEKDPRNLLTIFQLVAYLATNFKLGSQAEELFEIVACYFPIDFTPPADFDESITRQELASSLQKCLVSSTSFSAFLLPFALEKLSSSVQSIKIDSLQLLIAAIEIYDAPLITSHVSSFWAQIRNDIYVVKQDVQLLLLKFLQLIIVKLASHQKIQLQNLKMFLDDIYEDCGKHLYKPEANFYFEPSSNLILATVHAHIAAAIPLCSNIIPKLVKDFQSYSRNDQITISIFIMAMLKVDENIDLKAVILAHFNDLTELRTILLSSDNAQLRSSGFKASILLALTSSDALQTELQLCLIKEFLLNENDKSIWSACIKCIVWLVPQFEKELCHFLLPPFFEKIVEDKDESKKEFLLEILYNLSNSQSICVKNITHILNILNNSKHDIDFDNQQVIIWKSCLNCLTKIIENWSSDLLQIKDSIYDLLEQLLKFCETVLSSDSSHVEQLSNHNLLFILCYIFSLVYRNYEDQFTITFANNLIERFTQSQTSKTISQTLWPLLCSILSSTNIQTEFKMETELLNVSFDTALLLDNLESMTAASQCVAILINKIKDIENENQFLQLKEDILFNIFRNISEKLNDGHQLKENMLYKKAIILWSWITKSLVMKNHPRQTTFSNQLVDMLGWSTDIGKLSADGFRVVVEPHQYVLSIDAAVRQTILFKQRFFSLTINRLVEAYHSCSQETKLNHIIALSHLIRHLDTQVVQMELANILPIMITSLSFDNIQIMEVVLSNLCNILKSSPDILVNYFDDILPILLSVSYNSNMKIRLATLECIGCMSGLTSHVVLRNKLKVIRHLANLLDDKKRLVRAAASQTRLQWCLLGD